ncbi:lantibiotic immunity ABC transporter MutG family permease subunit [Clostridium oryzae]|uniref:ABC-2 family transporter protein n=1 Tax=Clostridium oryzae TaxID=1450648 RepID=A0A1V4IWE9_9CLOT|nr:lantibiotic immunity ABC transporter MutG family permease subunit [Clostridium oryzae]OPJ64219.1 ABC-2 family transporter protein [Clostridium oryzae]
MFWNSYRAEFYKNKKSVFMWLHIGLPVILTALLTFLCLGRKGRLTNIGLFGTFFQMIGYAMTLIAAVLCSLVVSQEQQAGGFQMMLGKTRHKVTTFISQLCMLLSMCAFALLLAVVSFLLSMKFVLHIKNISYIMFIKTAMIVFISVIFLYSFYLIIAYCFGTGISNIMGFAGVIISALACTGQGDSIWRVLPWAWSVRLSNFMTVSQYAHGAKVPLTYKYYQHNDITGGLIMGIMTVCCLSLSIAVFYFWEGRQRA